ncbi:hypothetical protein [Senegalia massiliensis]|uniref:hypothetical protein n=1 Tax=Senegalia massiliensis TaxID=1720316 RepID=UPI001031C954|nr:hypothetical protein [Senegalia massiliensis]
MSRFLGPIHHWLFNKIKLHEKLEKNIVESLEDKYGLEIEQTHSYFIDSHGSLIDDNPLEELIDTNNIHGWLQERINIAETRFADFITTVLDKFPGEAIELIENEYKKQGRECGINSKEKYPINNAIEIYKSLNNYILDGMPCDNANNIINSTEKEIEWQITNCLHKKYWEKVGGNTEIFHNLRSLWNSNFVENANASFRYEYINNEGNLNHKIYKK